MENSSQSKKFKCDTCEKELSSRTNLKRHVLLHDKTQKSKCESCNKSFSSKKKSQSTRITNS